MSETKKLSLANRLAAAQKRQEAALQMTNANFAERAKRIAAEANVRRAMGIKSNNMPGGIDPSGKNINKLSGFANIGSPVSSLGSPVTPEGKGGRKRTYKQRKYKTRKHKAKKSKTRKH
jgi:hypothetical protein